MKIGVRMAMMLVVVLALTMTLVRQRTDVVTLPDVGYGAQAGYQVQFDAIWARIVFADTRPGGRRVEWWPAWTGPSVLCRFGD